FRPLLKRCVWTVVWHDDTAAKALRDVGNDPTRPCIEWIGNGGRLALPPLFEMGPVTCPFVSDEHDSPRRTPLTFRERSNTADAEPGRHQRLRDFQRLGRHSAPPLVRRILKGAAPDFLVDDVGHFSPA